MHCALRLLLLCSGCAREGGSKLTVAQHKLYHPSDQFFAPGSISVSAPASWGALELSGRSTIKRTSAPTSYRVESSLSVLKSPVFSKKHRCFQSKHRCFPYSKQPVGLRCLFCPLWTTRAVPASSSVQTPPSPEMGATTEIDTGSKH